jgi:hypothetical protein
MRVSSGTPLAPRYDSDEYLSSGFATRGDRVYALGNKYAYAFRCS